MLYFLRSAPPAMVNRPISINPDSIDLLEPYADDPDGSTKIVVAREHVVVVHGHHQDVHTMVANALLVPFDPTEVSGGN